MLNNQEKKYQEWFKKADDDELNARSILKHRDGTPTVVCFLSQQMTEKYLKGLLIFYNKTFSKIHDLLELETLLLKILPKIKKELHQDLKLLNRYYIETRYPGDYPEFYWSDAEEAFAAAKRIREFVLEKIKSSSNSEQKGSISFRVIGIALAVVIGLAVGYAAFQTILNTIGTLLGYLIPILTITVTVVFIWGVISYILSARSGERKKEVRNLIIWGLIGLFVVIAMWWLAVTSAFYFVKR